MADSSYRRVNARRDSAPINPNEIRITTKGRPRSYISYAVGLLDPSQAPPAAAQDQQATPKAAQAYDEIVLKAMRRAINKAVSITEIVKRRVAGLHQITEVHSTPIVEEYEPQEEGLQPVSSTRTVSSITIRLSKKPLDTKNVGYQPPLPESEVTKQENAHSHTVDNAAAVAHDTNDAPQRRIATGGTGARGFRGGYPRGYSRGDRGDRGAPRGGHFHDKNDRALVDDGDDRDDRGGRGGRGDRGYRGGYRGYRRGRGGRGRGRFGGRGRGGRGRGDSNQQQQQQQQQQY